MKKIGIFLIMIMFYSCEKKGNQPEEYKGIQLTESLSESLGGNINYTLELPDTLKVNQPYDAVFYFDSPFDTIVEPMVDTINFRSIKFSYYKPIKLGNKILKSDIVLKDSVYIPNKEFILGNVKFEEKGRYLFLVLIEDQIMYNFYNNKGKRDSIHFDRIFEEIKKEVVVIE